VDLAVGTDTGGSIRIPAAFCGVLGLKTTFGRIPRTGVLALAPAFDSIGFLARTTELLIAALQATAWPSIKDPATVTAPAFNPPARIPPLAQPLTFATPARMAPRASTPARDAALAVIINGLEHLGAVQVQVSTPCSRLMYEIFAPLQMSEALYVHRKHLGTFPEAADSYGADVRERLERAASITLGDFLTYRAEADLAASGLHAALQGADLLVSLVGSTGPSHIAHPDIVEVDGSSTPLRDAILPSTVPQNLAGLPSITVPGGFDEKGLPVGVQITGSAWSEPLLLAVANALEREGVFTVGVPRGFDTE
jgi:Asp-tRNA(Asn)/Glu-tRNA(Gln) amidotransferase A subunit family amidase